jgi:hypothetical protein
MADLGRPTVMTPETIAKLEQGFMAGLSDREASLYANIAPSTLYAYCAENLEFSERKELLKEQTKMWAKLNVDEGIRKGNSDISKWFLERRDPDFKPKQETDNKGQVTINIVRFEDSNNPSSVPAEDVPASAPQSA